jgi:hypothetical protein
MRSKEERKKLLYGERRFARDKLERQEEEPNSGGVTIRILETASDLEQKTFNLIR